MTQSKQQPSRGGRGRGEAMAKRGRKPDRRWRGCKGRRQRAWVHEQSAAQRDDGAAQVTASANSQMFEEWSARQESDKQQARQPAARPSVLGRALAWLRKVFGTG